MELTQESGVTSFMTLKSSQRVHRILCLYCVAGRASTTTHLARSSGVRPPSFATLTPAWPQLNGTALPRKAADGGDPIGQVACEGGPQAVASRQNV